MQSLLFQFAVSRTDGSPYNGFFGRQLMIHVTREGDTTVTEPEQKVIIPDTGIVQYQILPTEQDDIITVRVCISFIV